MTNSAIFGVIGIMEKKMRITIMGYIGVIGFYWGYIGIMEKKMETTIMGLYRDYSDQCKAL